MPPLNRSPWRNTYIYSSDNRSTVLGGLWAAAGVTNANLYSMLQVFCFFTHPFDLHDSSKWLVERDGQPLTPGNYYIATAGFITVTNEVALTRTTSFTFGTLVTSFSDAVRHRDRRCVITGRPALLADLGCWDTFEATHIVPLAYEEYWNDHKYSSWITVPPARESDGSINSVQNGILLRSEIHTLFNSYKLTIDPDDNYKIVCFAPDAQYFITPGRHLDQAFLDHPLRPVDELLRWHFRQAVLVNMKGAGEPCYETDFPPGSDMMGQIIGGVKAAERMEFELFSRFNARGNAS